MRIDANGNVGIGTPSPGALLDIGPSTVSQSLRVTNTNTVNGMAGYFNNTSGTNSAAALQATTNGTGISLNLTNTGTGGLINATTNSATTTAVSISSSNATNTQPAIWVTYGGTGTSMILSGSNSSQTGDVLQTTGTTSSPVIYAQNDGTGYAVSAYKGVASGGAGYFSIGSNTNSSTALSVNTSGTGYTGTFTGGKGLQTDIFTMTNTSGMVGAILTATNTTGGAAWVVPQQPVNFSGSGSTTSTIPSVVLTPISFSSVDYQNPVGTFDGTVFTATATGVYHIDAVVTFSANASTVNSTYQLQIDNVPSGTIKTSLINIPAGMGPGTLFQNQVSSDIQMAQGQQIQIGAYLSSSGGLTVVNLSAYTYITGHLIR